MRIDVRKDKNAKPLTRDELETRFKQRFIDPIYDRYREAIDEMAALAWQAHQENHKAPLTKKAGRGYSDPAYDLSIAWLNTKAAINKAERLYKSKKTATNILLISGSDRNDQSCPGEVSKTRRLVEVAHAALKKEKIEVQLLDLSQIISEYGKHIHPCKACVSTAMPLCHWPCSCYPNHATDQINDWMNEIYPMWVRAHGIMIITPVYWNQAPSTLKLMIDRLVCADGGNPDPTTTQGKDPKLAKQLELKGWNYPRHLAGRVFSVFVHGDTEGVDLLRASLRNWLVDMQLIPASTFAATARYIGYYKPYATSHKELDKDTSVQSEVREAAIALAKSTKLKRKGLYKSASPDAHDPRPK